MQKILLISLLFLSFKMQAQTLGYACIYSKSLCGGKTASGKNLDCSDLTAAHRTFPLGSKVRVTNLKTGNSAVVTITDRGPFSKKLSIDLTPRAAKAIDLDYVKGIVKVKIEKLSH
jgi:rare lipoprotein A